MVPWYLMGGIWYIYQWNQYQGQWNQYQGGGTGTICIMYYSLHNYQNLRELSWMKAIQHPLKLVVANLRPSFYQDILWKRASNKVKSGPTLKALVLPKKKISRRFAPQTFQEWYHLIFLVWYLVP